MLLDDTVSDAAHALVYKLRPIYTSSIAWGTN